VLVTEIGSRSPGAEPVEFVVADPEPNLMVQKG